MKKRTLLSEDCRKNATPEQNAQYASTLKEMVDCKTIWKTSGENAAEFARFYDVIAQAFPNLHSKAQRLTFGDGCFFYVIEGKEPKKNILLMSHHDVVEGGEGWNTDPFRAEVQDGALWGRGTVDTKTPLFAQLQAAEELLGQGYDFPGIRLFIGSSNNEEVSGDGMVLAADYFRNEGIRFEAILDEGGAITTGMIPGVSAKSAVIAVHEKGRHLFRCTVKKNGKGHGGLNPSKGNPVSAMSQFIAEVTDRHIFKAEFSAEVKATFESHAPYMTFPLNVVFGNFPIFAPLIKKIMSGIPQAAAMLSTGVAFPSIIAGDPEFPHISANAAQAHMFLRCIREETMYRELEQIKVIASKYGIEIEEVLRDYCEPTDFHGRPYQILEQLIHENFPDVITAPFLLTAGTDARRFTGIADSILRFAPIDLSKQQFASIHGANENITIQNIGQCVLFYKNFIQRI